VKIYTKTGDKGQTSLLRGGRVPKHHPRVEVYGTMDELNSQIGFVRSLNEDAAVEEKLAWLQERLHVLCSDVAAPPSETEDDAKIPRISAENVEHLEHMIDQMDSDLPQLTHFILPGGCPPAAALHVARTICRRGERRLTEIVEMGEPINAESLRFVNRLSDTLFTLARWTNSRAGQTETPWIGKEKM
jgi:cob(I)alamin adenosyltransferase